jgi:hypothetical protein
MLKLQTVKTMQTWMKKKTTASSVYDCTLEDVEYIYNMTVLLLLHTYTELVIDES